MDNQPPDIEKIQGELRIMGMSVNDYSLYFTQMDNQVKEVELRFQQLQNHIPSQIFKIEGLNILRLSNITDLPDEISNLKQLRLLEVVKHHNRRLNPEICKLTKLELLIIRRSNIESLPKNLSKLKRLRDIDLINNNIPEVPQFLSSLPNLKYISLSGFNDSPDKLSEKLLEFKGLKKLFLGKFEVKLFPDIWEGITALQELTHLTISGYSNLDDEIEYVSPLINSLENLESLWVDGAISCFPDIPDLKKLNELYLTFTPLNNSAKAILETKKGVCINPDCEIHSDEGNHR